MKVLTIIVPCFNVEKYLHKTLQSFICKEDYMKQLEVLIINDGSTDGTESVANEFVSAHPSTFSLLNKPNGGHGSTINSGLRLATGKYTKIIDGDDWAEEGSVPALIDELKKTDVDAVLTNYKTFNMVTEEVIPYPFPKTYTAYGNELSWPEHIPAVPHFTLCTACFNTQYLKSLDFTLQENTFYVDEEYIFFTLSNIKTWKYTNIYLYVYLIGNTQQSISIKNRIGRLDHYHRVICRLVEYVRSHTNVRTDRPYCLDRLVTLVTTYYLLCLIYHPDREIGKHLAAELHKNISDIQELRAKSNRKYKVFLIMHNIHISGNMYDCLSNCKMLKFLHAKY
ncbi:glycosyltransferase family 2 protein [Neobittarella massiliensis]|uniref:Chondroitin polymerase n=1 Tax=uncultured Anaerotruncus sp. TaxID=905011 RepID=A0A1C6JDJ8_9FIRM|nr:glycosyltransferase family 2 protein [Neobittarella massiliensis]SCJ80061.1 Chondroitin polymerase [uncultured Anaerotruncus sp.]